MNWLMMFAMILVSSQSLAAQKIKLDPVGFGKLLHVGGNIKLPTGQKLKHTAPSKVDIYEKEKGQWALTETIDLNQFFALSELIYFQKAIKLKSEKSEIKLEASLYHCPRLGRGICVIDDYEGIITRNANKVSSEVKVSLVGSPPK